MQIENASTESESIVDLCSEWSTSTDFAPVVSFIRTPATRPSTSCPTTGYRKPKAKKVVPYPTVSYNVNGFQTVDI